MMISLSLQNNGSDTLFWHENTANELPGNMQYLINNSTRTKHIVFQNYVDWQIWKNKLPKNGNIDFKFLGMIYPHPRGNKMRPEAVILTNSDQIEHLDEVVQAMPNIHFHIAAITEMSSKLLAFKKYNNVHLYPNATTKQIQKLYQTSDIYLDINHGNEILDAVRGAFEQNMLIVGFEGTLHNPKFISSENIFKPTEVDKMANRISEALSDTNKMREFIDEQRLLAGDVSVEQYKEVINNLR